MGHREFDDREETVAVFLPTYTLVAIFFEKGERRVGG